METAFVKWPTENTTVFAGEFISLRAIGRRLNLSYAYLSRVFRGQRQLTPTTAVRLAACLEMPLSKFMLGLEIHIAASKIYGKNLPLLIPKPFREQIDSQTKAAYTVNMAESCIVDNPSKQTVKLGDLSINLSVISRSLGLSVSYLSRIFSGSREPSIRNAKRIAAALGVELGYFLAALDMKNKGKTDEA